MGKKSKKIEINLNPEEQIELESIMERLKLQNPKGETFGNFTGSLIERLSNNENLLAALVERIGKEPSEAGVELFRKIRDKVPKRYKRIVKRVSFRLAQRGYTVDETTSDDNISTRSRVLLIPTPSETEDALAGMFFRNTEYVRVFAAILPPTPSTEATFLIVLETPKTNKLETQIYYESKNTLTGIYKEMKDYFKYCEIPLYHLAQLITDRIEVFSDMLDPESREKTFEAKRTVRKFLPEDPEKFFKENLKDLTDSEPLDGYLSELINEVKNFEFDIKSNFENFVISIDSMLNPTIECSWEARQYQMERKTLEFFKNLNEFSLKRYYLFLIEEASRLISSGNLRVAARLYNVAGRLKKREFEAISTFLLKHALATVLREAFYIMDDPEYYKDSPYFTVAGKQIKAMQSWVDNLAKGCVEFLIDVFDEKTRKHIFTAGAREDENLKKLESGLYIPRN